jgi:MFS family permease
MRMDAQRMKAWWPWVLVFGALAFVYGPTLGAHISRGFNPQIFNDDARQQIYPFFRYADSALFPNDYVGDYYLDNLPIGFRALYTISAPLIDPAISNKIVMYLMLLVTILGLGAAANRLGGKVAAWAAMSLALGASLYIDRMGGGLPRAFGFPILAWALVALSYGRTRWLAALVWLGACFYPVTGVLVGLATAFLLLLLPASDRGDAQGWDLRRRLRFLTIVAGASIVLLLPTIVSSSKYAPAITPDDVAQYPEAGPGGRYAPDSRAPYRSFFDGASTAVARGFVGVGKPWVAPVFEWVNADEPHGSQWTRSKAVLALLAIFTTVGWLLFVASSGAARRVMMFGLAAFIGYSIARLVPPYFYLPDRYTTYSMPLLAVLMVSTSVAGFFSMRDKRGADPKNAVRAGVTLVFCLFVLASVGGRGSSRAGLNIELGNKALYDAIGTLPVEAVVAGWPQTAIENAPYVARRTALLTFETHQAFHQKYVDEMRQRMRAIIDATLATSDAPLIRLRDEQGVTHMLVYLPHLGGARPRYFKPFDRWIAEARSASAGKPLLLQELVDKHAIYRDRNYALVDLRELRGPG